MITVPPPGRSHAVIFFLPTPGLLTPFVLPLFSKSSLDLISLFLLDGVGATHFPIQINPCRLAGENRHVLSSGAEILTPASTVTMQGVDGRYGLGQRGEKSNVSNGSLNLLTEDTILNSHLPPEMLNYTADLPRHQAPFPK